MLESGLAAPYFIWPNLDPFKKQPTLLDAVPAPADIAAIAGSGRLKKARDFVAAARVNGLGIFGDGLRLEPFELRLLAGQRAPDRWVIDLSADSGICSRRATITASPLWRTGSTLRPNASRCSKPQAGSVAPRNIRGCVPRRDHAGQWLCLGATDRYRCMR